MKITEKDKKLLLVLAIVAVLCLPYFFVVRPFTEKTNEAAGQVQELRDRKSQLESIAAQGDFFLEESEKNLLEEVRLYSLFPTDITQEGTLLFINNAEHLVPIILSQATFGEDVAAQITSEAEQEAIDQVEEETGEATEDAVIEDNTEVTQLGAELSGKTSTVDLTYGGSYTNFKDFLRYVQNYPRRMVITDITAAYSGEMDMVTGSVTLAQYAVQGKERPDTLITEPRLRQGSSNIFMQAAGKADNSGENGMAGADFFLMLSQPEADVEAKVFGRSGDGSKETYLSSDANSLQEAVIRFEGSDGEYTASYQMGKEKYSGDGEGVAFEKKGSIDFEIISSPRVGEDDEVSVKVNIINETDTTVNVRITGDDEEKPRVEISKKTGDVLMK